MLLEFGVSVSRFSESTALGLTHQGVEGHHIFLAGHGGAAPYQPWNLGIVDPNPTQRAHVNGASLLESYSVYGHDYGLVDMKWHPWNCKKRNFIF